MAFALPSDSSASPSHGTAAQVPFDLHIPYNPFLASEYEIQYEISPLQFLYGLVKKLPSVLSRDLLGALLCCPCSRYLSEKGPKCRQGPDTMRLPCVCRGHLPLALPDQEARNGHFWSPLLAISIHSDLAALPSPGRAQCTLTEGSHPSLSPRPSIVKTLYPPCAAVQLWKPFNRVPVVQTRAQACNWAMAFLKAKCCICCCT